MPCLVVADIGDHEVRLAVQGKGGEVFPVFVIRLLEFGPAEAPAALVDGIQRFFRTAVVDDPQDIGLALGARETAGLTDPGVFQAARRRETEASVRLIGISAALGAAGEPKAQQ